MLFDEVDRLLDVFRWRRYGIHLHMSRLREPFLREFANLSWHGCRKHESLPSGRHGLYNSFQCVNEADVEHVIRLVEDQNFDSVKTHDSL